MRALWQLLLALMGTSQTEMEHDKHAQQKSDAAGIQAGILPPVGGHLLNVLVAPPFTPLLHLELKDG